MGESIIAVVEKIVSGKHGLFVVATSRFLKGSITFSLEPTTWKEDVHPQPGTIVILSSLTKKRLNNEHKSGWRASSARFFKPSDEK